MGSFTGKPEEPDQGDAAQALKYFQEALALSQGDLSSHAWALINLGRVMHDLGDDTQAQTYYAKSLASFRELEDRSGVGRRPRDVA
jgi:tetratricopeptide (TPR) repeat protein